MNVVEYAASLAAATLLALLLFVLHPPSSADFLVAVRSGDVDAVQAALAEDATAVNEKGERDATPLHVAAGLGHVEIVELLAEAGASLVAKDVDGDTPLHWAAQKGRVDAAAVLIELGTPVDAVNARSGTALHYAALEGRVEVLTLLLEFGADIDARIHGGETALSITALRNRHATARFLLEAGADPEVANDYGRTPLLQVARETGNVEMAKLLLDAGAEVDALDRYGESSLGLVAWRGFRPLVDVLLDAGAAISPPGPRRTGMTIHAAERGLGRLFTLLAEAGADLELRTGNGGSLLHVACEGGAEEVIAELLGHGLVLDEQDRYGWTPLHYAAKRGRAAAVELLIECEAELETRTIAGSTARNVAEEFGHHELADWMVEHGAAEAPPAFPALDGPYLGQTPPGREPVLFAVDIVSSNRFEHGTVTFSPDGTEAFWSSSYLLDGAGYSYGRILTSRLEDGRWTPPRMASFSDIRQGDDVPFFAVDGSKLYFLSSRPGAGDGENVWWIDPLEGSDARPRPLAGGPNDMGTHWQFSVAANGNVYLNSGDPGGFGSGDLYVSRFVDGRYLPGENLGDTINSEHEEASPYVAPDESYLIVTRSGHPDDHGDGDLCVSFRGEDGSWSKLVALPPPINTPGREMCPYVTADGEYLFFNSMRNGNADNYWVSAEAIEELRSKAR